MGAAFIRYCLLFLFVYSVQFSFIPFGMGTRVLLGILGIILYIEVLFKKKRITINSYIARIVVCLLLVALYSAFSLFINLSSDISFIKYPVSVLNIFFAAYLVYRYFSYHYLYNYNTITKYFIIVVVLQIFLSLLMFILPSFKQILFSVLYFSELEKNVIDWNQGIRLLGFGSTFFGAGIINSVALIFIAAKLKYNQNCPSFFILLTLTFFFILLFGSMMSRTTLIGGGLGIILFLYNDSIWKFRVSRNLKNAFKSIGAVVCLFMCSYMMLPDHIKKNVTILSEFSFEIVLKYIQEGEISSDSTDELINMYDIYPRTLKTYLIGDGHYVDPDNSNLYYKGTDIGYLRLIFYFGVVGLSLYLLFHYLLMKYACLCFSGKESVFITLFLLLLILNFKGFADLSYIFMLFLFDYEKNKNFTSIR